MLVSMEKAYEKESPVLESVLVTVMYEEYGVREKQQKTDLLMI